MSLLHPQSQTMPLEDEPTISQLSSAQTTAHNSAIDMTPCFPEKAASSTTETATGEVDPELRLPKLRSLLIIILGNALFQFSFFFIIPSASTYAEYLGGDATFSGISIGIPTVVTGIVLVPMVKIDQGRYRMPFNVAYFTTLVGNVLYALAYRANFLYLTLIGRIVSGFGCISFMYTKRYCTDNRLVGIRRRTTLASLIVIGQGFGFSAGPFVGGLLYKIGFSNDIFNGYTSPGWVMAGAWAAFWVLSEFWFEDVPPPPDMKTSEPKTTLESGSTAVDPSRPQSKSVTVGAENITAVRDDEKSSQDTIVSVDPPIAPLTLRQWGVIVTILWDSMACFFILGAWETNIPVFTAAHFGYSPYNAGNFIALGGIATFPFLFLNFWYARRVEDRYILAAGSGLGLVGLAILLATLLTDRVTFGSFYVCWFLVALGFNLASTCTYSLLSKQLPQSWNGRNTLAIQYSNYIGRVAGAVWGGAGVHVGMQYYAALQVSIVGLGVLLQILLWRDLKANKG